MNEWFIGDGHTILKDSEQTTDIKGVLIDFREELNEMSENRWECLEEMLWKRMPKECVTGQVWRPLPHYVSPVRHKEGNVIIVK